MLFILALRGLSSAKTATKGNWFGIAGMTLALLGTQVPVYFANLEISLSPALIKILIVAVLGGIIGYVVAKKVNMTALPQLLAGFHSLVGLAAVFISLASFFCIYGIPSVNHDNMRALEMVLGAVIGAITFTGSVVAFGKLQGIISGKPWRFKGQRQINIILGGCLIALIIAFVIKQTPELLIHAIVLSLVIGYLLIMPIGGADMPVVISMLNSYSGWATAGIGFSANNRLLVIVGALVGTSGAILSHIMCKGMNRSLVKVIFGGFSSQNDIANRHEKQTQQNVKLCS
ncbi:MAG: NAD(P)(+) transhydrogenase (Re/Si-specific) subunit beta, partial [Alphaproteobacteria bacterium]|nr:NAD(P)(+) transhydrogenase (Re/Si-specific) subunit beta [Alphaproteobacteria bacterium]